MLRSWRCLGVFRAARRLWPNRRRHAQRPVMLNDREHISNALREKPLKAFEIEERANIVNDEACQALLLKMRDEGVVKFDISTKGNGRSSELSFRQPEGAVTYGPNGGSSIPAR
jgi:hypothetical protein